MQATLHKGFVDINPYAKEMLALAKAVKRSRQPYSSESFAKLRGLACDYFQTTEDGEKHLREGLEVLIQPDQRQNIMPASRERFKQVSRVVPPEVADIILSAAGKASLDRAQIQRNSGSPVRVVFNALMLARTAYNSL